MTGLTNGTAYTFTVTATNVAGTGSASSASTAVVPATVPGAATGVDAVFGDSQALVSWTAPSSTGGAAITSYTVTSSSGSRACTTTTTSCTVTGLTNGTAYTFTVTASNKAGTGSASSASSAVVPATVPDAPTSVTGVFGDSQALVSWTAPSNTGGSVITAYTVTSSPGSFICTTSTTSCTVTGLTNGTNYTFTVTATNVVGAGTPSDASLAVSPATVPGVPTGVIGTSNDASVLVSWSAPFSTGGASITSYTVTSLPGSFTCTTSTMSCTVTGLTNGTNYTFTVLATNKAGSGAVSSASGAVTPAGAPRAVSAVVGVFGDSAVTVSWTIPTDNGGSAITGYTVTASPGGFECSTSGTSCTVSGLTNGTAYTFSVVALNAVGSGSAMTSAAVVPASIPGSPSAATTQFGDSSMTVSWTAPSSNGGSEITLYTVTSSPGSFTCTTSTTSCTVTGLTNGIAYTFTVKATNKAGSSVPSALALGTRTPATVPGAPTSLSGSSSGTQITVNWTAPKSDGGSGVTGYRVTASPSGKTCTSTSTSCVFTSMGAYSLYTFTVVAINKAGSGAPSDSLSVGVVVAPEAPTGVVGVFGDSQVTVSWIAPVSDGGNAITLYTVTALPGRRTCTATSATSCTVTGLTNGGSYTFTVVAANSRGDGQASEASDVIIPASTPGFPRSVAAVAGNAQASVSWTAPASSGGSAITTYTVTSTPGSFTCTTATASCTVTGLTNGTSYKFVVTATNKAGTGTSSLASGAIVPATVPGAPSAVTGVFGDGAVIVSWAAPLSNGGSAITGYTVTASPGSFTCTSLITTCTVSGLTNGSSYTFTVVATNSVGTGSPSGSTAGIIPAAVPGAPTSATTAFGDSSMTVSWTAPTSNGGSAITSYTVTSSTGSFTCSTVTTSCTVLGLTNGTPYAFTVKATNRAGSGAASAVATGPRTPATFPGAPTGVSGSSSGASVTVVWTAPADDGGDDVSSYRVTASPGGRTCISSTTTCVFNAMSAYSSYTFSVVAINKAGAGTPANSGSVVLSTVPGAPTGVTGAFGGSKVVVSWTAPVSDGGATITGYTVTASPGGATCRTAGGLTCTVWALTNGTAYSFSVVATNKNGDGAPASLLSTITPATTPSAPRNVAGTSSASSVVVSWLAPTSNGGGDITSYTVTSSPGLFTCTTAATSCTVTGLSNGTSYTFTVVATNKAGSGPSPSPSTAVVPAAAPGAPTGVSGVFGSSVVTVSWSAPASNGGASITRYTVTSTPGSKTCITDGYSCTVGGLTNGTSYTFTVIATNAAGSGPTSTASRSVTPATTPSIPLRVKAAYGSGSLIVSWSAPAVDGGAPITTYSVASSPGSFTCTTTELTCAITGLTSGIAYSFTVTATNIAGTGSASSPSTPMAVASVPAAPTSVVGTFGDSSVLVVWDAPASNGASVISSYSVISSPGGFTCTTATTSCTVTGLTNGTSYTFTVAAANAVGAGIASVPSGVVIPAAVPGVPTSVVASSRDSSSRVTWDAPSSTGGATITSFTVSAQPVAATTLLGDTNLTTSGTLDSLHTTNWSSNGQYVSYAFSSPAGPVALALGYANGGVRAVRRVEVDGVLLNSTANFPGTGSSSTRATATLGSVTLKEGRHTVTITCVIASGCVGSLDAYHLTYTNGATPAVCVTPGTAFCTVTGLTNGASYTFTVTATNKAGSGVASTASTAVIPATVPDAPASAVGTFGDGRVSVTWSLPTTNGGSVLTGYVVTSSPASDGCASMATLGCTVTGLSNGVAYVFTVAAKNANGKGAGTSTTAVTPMTLPGEPTAVLATAGSESTLVSWTAPESTGGGTITSYTVTASPGGANCIAFSATSCTVWGLTNYTKYSFTVTAMNAAGRSAASDVSAKVMPIPDLDAPTDVAVSVSRSSATISWTAPGAVAELGLAVTYNVVATTYRLSGWTSAIVDGESVAVAVYTVTSRSVCSKSPVMGSTGRSWTSTTCSADDLLNGTSYIFSVTASVDGYTSSTATLATGYTPTGVPGRATSVSATSGVASAVVTWGAPSDDGGFPVSSYRVLATPTSGCPDGTTCPVRTCISYSTSCAVTRLSAGVAYVFAVYASNSSGSSKASENSDAITIPSAPGAPTAVTASVADGSVLVSWNAPLSNGGLPVTSYLVTSSSLSPKTCTAVGGTSTANCRIAGLTTGQSYTFTVTATNDAGTGTSSTASNAVTAMVIPSAPLNIAGVWGNGSVLVSWSAPSSTGGGSLVYSVSGYYTADNGATKVVLTGLCASIAVLVCEVSTPITAAYFLTVTAANAAGSGPESGALRKTLASVVPDAPTAVKAQGSSGSALISWTQSFNGGPAISAYYAVSYSAADSVTHTCSSASNLYCRVSGLLSGVSYTFTVYAKNASGVSATSSPSASTSFSSTPGAPRNAVVTPGVTKAFVSWTAPESNGGSVITSYVVSAWVTGSDKSKVLRCTATSTTWCIVSGLTAGQPYTFTVRALNNVSAELGIDSTLSVGSFTMLSSFAIGAYTFSSDSITFDSAGRFTGTGSLAVESVSIPISFVYTNSLNWTITATSETRLFGRTPTVGGQFSSSTSTGSTVTVNKITLTLSGVTLGGYFGISGVFNLMNSTSGASLTFVGSATVAGYTLKTVTMSTFTVTRIGFAGLISTEFFKARVEGMVYLSTPDEELGYTITDVFGTERAVVAGDFYLAATEVQIGFASFVVTGEVKTGRSGGSNWFGFETRVKLGNGAAARSVAVVAAFGSNGDFKLGGGGTVLLVGIPVDVLVSYQSAAGGSVIYIEGAIVLFENTELVISGSVGWGSSGVSVVMTAQINFTIAGFKFGSALLTVAVTPTRQSITVAGIFDATVFRSSFTATFGVHDGYIYLRFTMEMNLNLGVAGANGSITVTNCNDADCTSIRDWTDLSVTLVGSLEALGRKFEFTQSLPIGFTFSFSRSYSFSVSGGWSAFSYGASGSFEIFLSSGKPYFRLSASLSLWAKVDLGFLGTIAISIGGGIDTDRGIWVEISGERCTILPFR